MKIWLVIVGVGLVSLLLRSSFLVLLRGRHLPERVTSSLGLVPAAVLAALIAPDLLVSRSTGTLDPLIRIPLNSVTPVKAPGVPPYRRIRTFSYSLWSD